MTRRRFRTRGVRGGLALLLSLALVMAPLLEAAQARELGGAGRRPSDFSRNGPAAGGGFATQRPAQRPVQRPVNKPGPAAQAERTERTEIRQENRTERTEIRQDGRTERNADRAQAAQNIANNWDSRHYHHHYYHDNDDDEWKGVVAGLVIGATVGYIAGAASRPVTTTYVAALPCTPVAVVSAGVRYYACDNVWYNRYYVDGFVRYVVVTTPPGY